MRNEEYREVGYYKLGEQKFSDKAKILTDVHVLKRIIDHSPNQYFTYVHFYLPCNYHGSVVPEIVGRGRQISIEYKGHTYNVDLDYPEASAYVENLLYLQFTISGSLQTMKDATIFAKEIERRMIKQLLENYVNNTQKNVIIQPLSVSVDTKNKVFAYATCRDTKFNHIINTFYLLPGYNAEQSIKKPFLPSAHDLVTEDHAEELGDRYMDNGQIYHMLLTQNKISISEDINDVINLTKAEIDKRFEKIKTKYYAAKNEIQKETNTKNVFYLDVGHNRFEIDIFNTFIFDSYTSEWNCHISIDIYMDCALNKGILREAMSKNNRVFHVLSVGKTLHGNDLLSVEEYGANIHRTSTFDEAKDQADRITSELLNDVFDTLRKVYAEKEEEK